MICKQVLFCAEDMLQLSLVLIVLGGCVSTSGKLFLDVRVGSALFQTCHFCLLRILSCGQFLIITSRQLCVVFKVTALKCSAVRNGCYMQLTW